MVSRARAIRSLVAAGRRLYEQRILVSVEGNLSLRLEDGSLLATPSGVHKGFLQETDVVELGAGGSPRGGGRPSSEIPMHLAIYQERPDVGAVVHAHPPVATGYAVAGVDLASAALAEGLSLFGCVPLAPYATPSTAALADAVREPVRSFDAVLLANHGAVTVGGDLAEAVERMAQLEHLAQISLVSHLLGGARNLSREQIDALSRIRQQHGDTPVPGVCYPSEAQSGTITLTRDRLVELIADAIRSIRS